MISVARALREYTFPLVRASLRRTRQVGRSQCRVQQQSSERKLADRGSMVAPRRVLLGLCFATAPAAAFQPARVSRQQQQHSVAVSSTIDNRRRSRSDNEASEGLGIVNVPVTEDAIKMAKEKLDGRPGSVASAATASAVAAAAAASDALPDVGFDPWSPFS